ncbi:MAG: nucleotidyltransferase family protein [Geobacter sp.]|nr:nucleotidyltransferase family protein [Geobacter sp.]
MQGTQEILEILRQSKQHLVSSFKVQELGLFGSVIRGEQHDGSDIDLLVDLGTTADLFDLIGISQYLEERLHAPVDVVPRNSLRQELRDQVLQEVRYI